MRRSGDFVGSLALANWALAADVGSDGLRANGDDNSCMKDFWQPNLVVCMHL